MRSLAACPGACPLTQHRVALGTRPRRGSSDPQKRTARGEDTRPRLAPVLARRGPRPPSLCPGHPPTAFPPSSPLLAPPELVRTPVRGQAIPARNNRNVEELVEGVWWPRPGRWASTPCQNRHGAQGGLRDRRANCRKRACARLTPVRAPPPRPGVPAAAGCAWRQALLAFWRQALLKKWQQALP